MAAQSILASATPMATLATRTTSDYNMGHHHSETPMRLLCCIILVRDSGLQVTRRLQAGRFVDAPSNVGAKLGTRRVVNGDTGVCNTGWFHTGAR